MSRKFKQYMLNTLRNYRDANDREALLTRNNAYNRYAGEANRLIEQLEMSDDAEFSMEELRPLTRYGEEASREAMESMFDLLNDYFNAQDEAILNEQEDSEKNSLPAGLRMRMIARNMVQVSDLEYLPGSPNWHDTEDWTSPEDEVFHGMRVSARDSAIEDAMQELKNTATKGELYSLEFMEFHKTLTELSEAVNMPEKSEPTIAVLLDKTLLDGQLYLSSSFRNTDMNGVDRRCVRTVNKLMQQLSRFVIEEESNIVILREHQAAAEAERNRQLAEQERERAAEAESRLERDELLNDMTKAVDKNKKLEKKLKETQSQLKDMEEHCQVLEGQLEELMQANADAKGKAVQTAEEYKAVPQASAAINAQMEAEIYPYTADQKHISKDPVFDCGEWLASLPLAEPCADALNSTLYAIFDREHNERLHTFVHTGKTDSQTALTGHSRDAAVELMKYITMKTLLLNDQYIREKGVAAPSLPAELRSLDSLKNLVGSTAVFDKETSELTPQRVYDFITNSSHSGRLKSLPREIMAELTDIKTMKNALYKSGTDLSNRRFLAENAATRTLDAKLKSLFKEENSLESFIHHNINDPNCTKELNGSERKMATDIVEYSALKMLILYDQYNHRENPTESPVFKAVEKNSLEAFREGVRGYSALKNAPQLTHPTPENVYSFITDSSRTGPMSTMSRSIVTEIQRTGDAGAQKRKDRNPSPVSRQKGMQK